MGIENNNEQILHSDFVCEDAQKRYDKYIKEWKALETTPDGWDKGKERAWKLTVYDSLHNERVHSIALKRTAAHMYSEVPPEYRNKCWIARIGPFDFGRTYYYVWLYYFHGQPDLGPMATFIMKEGEFNEDYRSTDGKRSDIQRWLQGCTVPEGPDSQG